MSVFEAKDYKTKTATGLGASNNGIPTFSSIVTETEAQDWTLNTEMSDFTCGLTNCFFTCALQRPLNTGDSDGDYVFTKDGTGKVKTGFRVYASITA